VRRIGVRAAGFVQDEKGQKTLTDFLK